MRSIMWSLGVRGSKRVREFRRRKNSRSKFERKEEEDRKGRGGVECGVKCGVECGV